MRDEDGDGRRERIKDGRHVGLDFYDLLIEPIMKLNGQFHNAVPGQFPVYRLCGI
jgi:hypothetical protein